MSLKKNTVANYLGQGWIALMGLAFVPVYIRYLGIEAWGLVGFMSMMQAWLTLLDMGLSPTLSREMARYQAGAHSVQAIRDLLRSLETVYCGVAVAVISGVAFIAPWLAVNWIGAARMPVETVTQAIGIMGLVLAARMIEQVYRGAIQGLQRQVWLNGTQCVLSALRWGGAAGVLIWVSPSIKIFFYWQGFISVLSVLVLAHQTYCLLPIGERSARFDLVALVRIRRFAGGMVATTLLTLLLTQVDKLLLSNLVALEDFGYYTLAASASSALYFLMSPIANAVSPRLTELVARSEQTSLVESYHNASQWLAAVLVPTALVISTFAEPALYVWMGDYALARQAAPLLALLALGTLCNGFMQVPYIAQLAHGWTGFAVRVNVIAVCFIVPVILWSVPRFGAVGAAWAWLLLNIGYVLIGMPLMHRRLFLGEQWRWCRDAVLKPSIIGIATVLVLLKYVTLPQNRIEIALVLVCFLLLVMTTVVSVIPVTRTFFRAQLKIFS